MKYELLTLTIKTNPYLSRSFHSTAPTPAVKMPSTTPRSSAEGTSGALMVIEVPPKRRTNSPCSGCATRSFMPLTSSSRSEEHTSELQSLRHLVCRLLLEKKKNRQHNLKSKGRGENSMAEKQEEIKGVARTVLQDPRGKVKAKLVEGQLQEDGSPPHGTTS